MVPAKTKRDMDGKMDKVIPMSRFASLAPLKQRTTVKLLNVCSYKFIITTFIRIIPWLLSVVKRLSLPPMCHLPLTKNLYPSGWESHWSPGGSWSPLDIHAFLHRLRKYLCNITWTNWLSSDKEWNTVKFIFLVTLFLGVFIFCTVIFSLEIIGKDLFV